MSFKTMSLFSFWFTAISGTILSGDNFGVRGPVSEEQNTKMYKNNKNILLNTFYFLFSFLLSPVGL